MKSRVDDTGLELFRKVKSGDLPGTRAFIEKYKQSVIAYCFSFVRDRFTAEHLSQIAFNNLIRAAPKIKSDEKFYSYLLKIARNQCLDFLEVRRLEKNVSPVPCENGEKNIEDYCEPSRKSPEKELIDEETKKQTRAYVSGMLERLPRAQREAIDLVHYKGLSYEEAAEIAGCQLGTMKSRVNRGMKNFTWSLARNKMDNLAWEERDALSEVCVNKSSFQKAARVLGCSKETIQERYYKALQFLRGAIQKEIEGVKVSQ